MPPLPNKHSFLTSSLGPQVSANLKLSEKQEVKKELVSQEGETRGQLALEVVLLLSSGAQS